MSDTPEKILVVDDDLNFLKSFSGFLKKNGYRVLTTPLPDQALHILEKERFSCIILDIQMPGMDGIALLKEIFRKHFDTPIIMFSQRYNMRHIVQAIKLGAYDFVDKFDDPDIILNTIRHAIESTELHRLRHVVSDFQKQLQSQHKIIAASDSMKKVLVLLNKAANTRAAVLLIGETGTGKTYLARYIHYHSNRALKPFVEFVPVSVPETLIESELFGYKKGAFTDARTDKKGVLELADGGTLFLDEIGEIPITLQPKLNQFLDSQQFYPLGSNKMVQVDVRLISATNKPYAELQNGSFFRQDLFYRISTIVIEIPPLRERTEDIWPLALHFFEKYKNLNPVVKSMNPRCRIFLERHSWPGNVRELENLIRRLIILSDVEQIVPEMIQESFRKPISVESRITNRNLLYFKDLRTAREEFEREYILHALKLTNHNQTQAAAILKIDRSHLLRKLKKYGLC
ncbi:MAG: sigma-54-dependent Fis family transcriptional regulator [Calditrichaeota bacterium]|nr:sigma-54-dependent Fis family transcriptional regulator [Calditrichota bacterium]